MSQNPLLEVELYAFASNSAQFYLTPHEFDVTQGFRGQRCVRDNRQFKRRPDDNEETVRTRMAEYRAKTAPILPIYEARGLVRRVDGMADIAHVTQAIESILDG